MRTWCSDDYTYFWRLYEPLKVAPTDGHIIDFSEYNPPRILSKTWRECIRKLWEDGPVRIISFITEFEIIKQILKHLGLWQQKISRSLPSLTKTGELVYVPCYDDWPIYEVIPVKVKW